MMLVRVILLIATNFSTYSTARIGTSRSILADTTIFFMKLERLSIVGT